MNSQADIPKRHVFGRWSFNADRGVLYDGETTSPLEPQVAKLLEHFLDHQNKVISRDELIAAVWDNRIVSDDAINRCISILRQILSPDDKHAYIETVVRKGYLAHFPTAPAAESRAAQPIRRRKYLYVAAAVGAAAIILYSIFSNFSDLPGEVREKSNTGPPVVAVLPFASASQTGDDEFFADGVHDDLLTQLTKLQSMRVISSTSVMEYRNTTRNIRKIGEELGADSILEGRVQIADNRIRINAQLIDAKSDEHLWAEVYDRELTTANIFDVQSEIARAIAVAMDASLTVQDKKQLTLVPTENMAAYRAYHRAMKIRAARDLTNPEFLEALEEAVELDPNYSRVWAELVTAHALIGMRGDNPESTRRAEQALQRLKTVAPNSADYLIGQAAYVYYTLKDYDRAHEIISQALTMNPSDYWAVELKSWIERRQGDFKAKNESLRVARTLDPRNPTWTDSLVGGLITTHDYEEALAEIDSFELESFPTSYHRSFLLFREHRDFGRLQKSVDELCQRYERPDCAWDARVANRDLAGALDALQKRKEREENDRESDPKLSENDRNRILTYWLMKNDKLLAKGMDQWHRKLEAGRDESGHFYWDLSYIGAAMLAGVQGNADDSEQLIQRWFRRDSFDWADLAFYRDEACHVLGMIAATDAAVKCIRDGLEEPSLLMPFMEPYLPYYDSIRDEPAFINMLAEIDPDAPATTGH